MYTLLRAALGETHAAAAVRFLDRRRPAGRANTWHSVAERRGLECRPPHDRAPSDSEAPRSLAGRIVDGGHSWFLEVKEHPPDATRDRWSSEFRLSGGSLPRFDARRRREPILIALPIPAPDALGAELGSPGFDHEVRVTGEEVEVCAVLGGETRERLLEFVLDGGHLTDGMLTQYVKGRIDDEASMERIIRRLETLASHLQSPADERPQRLLLNVESDSLRAVRKRSLELLLEHFPGSSEAVDACRAAGRDRAADVRLLGARHLVEEGWATVEEIVRSEDLDVALRLEGLEHLIVRVPRERLATLLGFLLASPTPELARRAARALGRAGGPGGAVAAHLAGRLAEVDPKTRAVFLQALGALDEPHAEAAILPWLTDPSPEVRRAAVEALGRCGTLAAVEPLRACEQAAGRVLEAGLREAVRDAVRTIQARRPGAASGQLSLAAVTAATGTLSVSPELGGALTAAQTDPARRAEPGPPGTGGPRP
ncbi:MAG: HEAT repeat domain-containing protein [Planctomycetes bacterium]|nr:HEAT repeat domain-containing protein [Planctomycetota bacterium]